MILLFTPNVASTQNDAQFVDQEVTGNDRTGEGFKKKAWIDVGT